MFSESTSKIKTVVINNVPPRSIVMYSGDASTIPEGWALCNGANGTPNLVDRFIVAADNTNNNTEGDADKLPPYSGNGSSLRNSDAGLHSHDAAGWFTSNYSCGKHSMTYSGFVTSQLPPGKNRRVTSWDGEHTHVISGTIKSDPMTTYESRPKWYALAFIMKTP